MTEKQMIVAIITHPAGYDVDLFSMFCVRPTEDGKFCVTYQPTGLPDPGRSASTAPMRRSITS